MCSQPICVFEDSFSYLSAISCDFYCKLFATVITLHSTCNYLFFFNENCIKITNDHLLRGENKQMILFFLFKQYL